MNNAIDYIIIGNGVAGAIAAESIRSVDSGGTIKVFTDEACPFYARMRLPEFLSGEVPLEKLVIKNIPWYEKHGIDLHLGEPVTDADPVNKTVTTGKGGHYEYKKLLLATGACSYLPPIEGIKEDGVFSLRTIDDAARIKERIGKSKKGIIIGGGLLGLEAGRAFINHGLSVCVIEHNERLLPRQMDIEGAKFLKTQMERIGYCFHLGLVTEKITKENGGLKVTMNDDSEITGDIILISAGVRPNILLAEKLGLTVDKCVVVDERMQTSIPDVYAAGDLIEFERKSYGIWPAAREQGEIAGANMAGITKKYEGTLMSNTLKVAGIDLATAGDIDAMNEGECIVKADNDKGTYKKYVIRDNKLVGGILLGDTSDQKKLEQAIKLKKDASELNLD